MIPEQAQKKYISYICWLLDIPEPELSHDTSHFSSETELAQAYPPSYTIYTREEYRNELDFYFSTAHELRHLWQYTKFGSGYFADYKAPDKVSLEEYNSQPAEVDAIAFSIIMGELFQRKPMVDTLTEKNRELIEKRIAEIIETEDWIGEGD